MWNHVVDIVLVEALVKRELSHENNERDQPPALIPSSFDRDPPSATARRCDFGLRTSFGWSL
jgi:hypothetical protein